MNALVFVLRSRGKLAFYVFRFKLPLIKNDYRQHWTNSTKLLGIHFDSNFSWQPHIEAILAKATQWLYFLKQLTRAGVPHFQLQHFYLTVVIRPVLEYASPVWHHLITKKQSDQIEAIQKSKEGHPHHLPLYTRHAIYKCHLPSWPAHHVRPQGPTCQKIIQIHNPAYILLT